MKKLILNLLFVVAALAVGVTANAQNLLTGGNMEDESAWDTISVAAKATHFPELTFNYTSDVPSAGDGGCLYIIGEMNAGGTDGQIDLILYQPIAVNPGRTYYVTGAIKDITVGGVFNFWSEVGFSLYDPAVYYQDSIDFFMAINAWEGCGPEVDGTYQDDFCKYTGPYYQVPDTFTGTKTLYLCIETGMYDNSSDDVYFDWLIDELSVVDSAGTPESVQELEANNAIALNHYPNPVLEQATITYNLPAAGATSLIIYNVLGEQLEVVYDGFLSAGEHEFAVDVNRYQNGVFFYSVYYYNKSYTRKMLITR